MTVLSEAPAPGSPLAPGSPVEPPAESGRPAAAKKRRRWHRVAIPFTILLTLVIGAFVLHSLNEPDRTDPTFLSPMSTADGTPISGSLLAQRLQDNGVHIRRFTNTSEALDVAFQGGYTLFVPSPSLMHRDYLRMLWDLPSNTRVVLVDPSASDLTRGRAPIQTADRRWATAAVPPGGPQCQISGLAGVGPAATYESAYAVDPDRLLREHSCYQGSVLQFRWTVADVVVVGSADPFRDDRIDEYDNSALAVGLLSTKQDLLWLDVHATEPGPGTEPDRPGSGDGGSSPGAGDGSPFPGGNGGGDGNGSDDGGDPGPLPGGGDPGSGRADGPGGPSFFDAFPPALWATLAGALLLGLLLALWQSRRLGPPVAEPLPFSVKGSETVLGRAQLYQRAGAILTGAQTLRRTVGPQIAEELGLAPTATPEELAAEITARYGGDPATYLKLLADELPKRDNDLVRLAADLDSLLAMVSTPLAPPDAAAAPDGRPAPQGETSG